MPNTKVPSVHSPAPSLQKVSDVAERLSVSESLVYKIIGSKELRSIKVRGAIRVREEHLIEYIEESTVETTVQTFSHLDL